ncbi:MAG: response regulator [Gemmatimonadota bacterium]|nr:response regulator [Gemmatimonadota bacterium]
MTQSPPLSATILVAEDSEEQRALYVEVLTQAGYRVLEAGDGAEALASVQRERPGLILMDVTMPGTSGWNAVRALREDLATRDIPIIVITGLTAPWDRDASIAAGCDVYLSKPVPPRLLLTEVRKFLTPNRT